MKDSLGDRIKRYESRTESYFLPKTPIIVRIDGKAFHTWTKGCERPFDQDLITTMFEAAKLVANEMQGCVALYAQSDEVTFVLLDNKNIESQQWFGGRQNKIESVTAALMTAFFNKIWVATKHAKFMKETVGMDYRVWDHTAYTPAIFDARAFQCPIDDVPNVFLWRVKDWERNSLTMYCSQFFSHQELMGQGRADRHEMLHKIGRNWSTECSDQQKNGSWWSKDKTDGFDLTNYDDIHTYIFWRPDEDNDDDIL